MASQEVASHDKTPAPAGVSVLRQSREGLHCNSFYATMRSVYYVYILENNQDEGWYIGYTADLDRRIKEHNTSSGGKTTRDKGGAGVLFIMKHIKTSRMLLVGRNF